MAAKGFFAALERQARAAQRAAEQQRRVAEREYNAAVRASEQARKADERARAQLARTLLRDRKQMEKEAKAAHVAAKLAEVDELNAELAKTYDELDNLLAATLDVDDYVDLETFRREAEHPLFGRTDLERPNPPPEAVLAPPEPTYIAPEPPKGLFGKKKKHAEAVAAAEAAYFQAREQWKAHLDWIAAKWNYDTAAYTEAERVRLATLEQERARYAAECAKIDAAVDEHNARLDTLIANLGYGTVEAVQEYVSIVLSFSVYPEVFPVKHNFSFDPTTAELKMRVFVPAPDSVTTTKAYKYVRAKDAIASTNLSKKSCKDRYTGAVHQVALRSIHEIYEADRRGLIKTISLEVGTNTPNPATGNVEFMLFVAVAAQREAFIEFDLSAVVPVATLEHLGAAVSKNPYGLVAVSEKGVRRS